MKRWWVKYAVIACAAYLLVATVYSFVERDRFGNFKPQSPSQTNKNNPNGKIDGNVVDVNPNAVPKSGDVYQFATKVSRSLGAPNRKGTGETRVDVQQCRTPSDYLEVTIALNEYATQQLVAIGGKSDTVVILTAFHDDKISCAGVEITGTYSETPTVKDRDVVLVRYSTNTIENLLNAGIAIDNVYGQADVANVAQLFR